MTEGRARWRRRWWPRRALPPSRREQALGGLCALVILALLLLGITRARPGRDVPDYVPPVPTTASLGSVAPPSITAVTTIPPATRPADPTPSTTRRQGP